MAALDITHEIGREGRKKLLNNADFNTEISPQEALAMKVNLHLSWNKLRIMRKYIHVHVHTSEYKYPITFSSRHEALLYQVRRSRERSHMRYLGVILSQKQPHSLFPFKSGDEDLRPAPLVFVPDLPAMIFQHLDQNDRCMYIYRYTSGQRIEFSTFPHTV